MKIPSFRSSRWSSNDSKRKKTHDSLPVIHHNPNPVETSRRRHSEPFATGHLFIDLEKRLQALKTENARLLSAQEQLQTIGEKKQEVEAFEEALREERTRVAEAETQIEEDLAKIQTVERYVEQLTKFIAAISDLGFAVSSQEDLSTRSVLDLAEREQDFVDAIRQQVAFKPNGIWNSIIRMATKSVYPSEDYILNIHRICEDRKETRQVKSIGDFWKSEAKKNAENESTITPSNSAAADIGTCIPEHIRNRSTSGTFGRRSASKQSFGIPSRLRKSSSARTAFGPVDLNKPSFTKPRPPSRLPKRSTVEDVSKGSER